MPYSMPQSWYDDYDPADVMYPDTDQSVLSRAAAQAQDRGYPMAAGAPSLSLPTMGSDSPSKKPGLGARIGQGIMRGLGSLGTIGNGINGVIGSSRPMMRTPPFQRAQQQPPSQMQPSPTMGPGTGAANGIGESADDLEDHTQLEPEVPVPSGGPPAAPTAAPAFTIPGSTSPSTGTPTSPGPPATTPQSLRGAANQIAPTITDPNSQATLSPEDEQEAARRTADRLLAQGPPKHSDAKYKRRGAGKIFGALGDVFLPTMTNRAYREDMEDYRNAVSAAKVRQELGEKAEDRITTRTMNAAHALYYKALADSLGLKQEYLDKKAADDLQRAMVTKVISEGGGEIDRTDPKYKGWMTVQVGDKIYGIPPANMTVTPEMVSKYPSLKIFEGQVIGKDVIAMAVKGVVADTSAAARTGVATINKEAKLEDRRLHTQQIKESEGVRAKLAREITRMHESGKNARNSQNAQQMSQLFKAAQEVSRREGILTSDLQRRDAEIAKLSADPLTDPAELKALKEAAEATRRELGEVQNVQKNVLPFIEQRATSPILQVPQAPQVNVPGGRPTPAPQTAPGAGQSPASQYLQKFK